MRVLVKQMQSMAIIPKYQSNDASGMDLHACLCQPVLMEHGESVKVPVGVAFSIPQGFEGQVRPRSGLSGRRLFAAFGTIDADYRGEVSVNLLNLTGGQITVHPGDRIAQLVIAPVERAQLETVDELDGTKRGANGFGSTGVGVDADSQEREKAIDDRIDPSRCVEMKVEAAEEFPQ
jgi:dUTP pyrophosphatase